MPAYVVGAVYDIKDPAGFDDYRSVAGPTVANFGGKFIAGGESVEAVEGDWAPLVFVVLEFESMEQAKRWYNSPEYQAVIAKRHNSTTSGLIMAEGMTTNGRS